MVTFYRLSVNFVARGLNIYVTSALSQGAIIRRCVIGFILDILVVQQKFPIDVICVLVLFPNWIFGDKMLFNFMKTVG